MGANGTGKSVGARELLASFDGPIIAVDPKGDFTMDQQAIIIRRPDDWRLGVLPNRNYIYRPDVDYLNGATWRQFFRMLWQRARKSGKRHPFLLYIDEAQFIANQGAGKELANLAITTRSLGMGLLCASQRPKWIPVEIRTEAWRWFIFYLSYDEDKKEITHYTSGRLDMDDLNRIEENYGFWLMERGTERPGDLTIRQCRAF